MPYININEYDYTLTGPKNYSGNIVAIPINASDGPADRWITVHTYDDFVQTFGPNPDTSLSEIGNSWEYAANLLLQGMSVCVRRITHVLDEETGENTKDLLPGVAVAKAIIKVKDIVGNNTSSDSYKSEKIPVIDVGSHGQLISSYVGDPVDNPSYLYNTYEEDGNTVIGAFPNPTVLQTETIKILDDPNKAGKLIKDDSFADVFSSNSEWIYIGKHDNPHYKYEEKDVPTSMDYIYKMNQTIDNNENPYVEGDFFITESNHIVKFTSNSIPNSHLLTMSQIQYPSELLKTIENKSSEELANKFVNVSYDGTNKTVVEKVWIYSEKEVTTVTNHLFVEGKVACDQDKSIKIFKTENDLPKTNIALGSFAGVKDENLIYVYTKGANSKDGWNKTAATINNLFDLESNYSVKVTIPFKCTDKDVNTDIYKTHFNWINTGEAEGIYIDKDNLHCIYLPYLYWENSNNPINTKPHKILSGAKVNVNTIVINKKADTSKTEFNLQVNGYNDFNFNKDYSDTRLVSGNFGLTNSGLESIKIYGFKIQQKDSTGNLYTAYDSNLENIINSNGRIESSPLLVFYNKEYDTVLDDPIPKLDDTASTYKWYIELEPQTTMYYNLDITEGIFTVKVAGYEVSKDDFKIDIHTFNSSHGRYDFLFKSSINSNEEPYVIIDKNFVPLITEETLTDFDNIPLLDGLGNFNLFTAEYKSPGIAGNNLNVRLRTIVNQGIYAYVYKGNQRLERIQLCSFRYRNANTGRVDILNMETEKDKVWKSIVSKFGIRISSNGIACNFDLKPLEKADELTYISGNYVNIRINDKILKTISSLDYVNSLYAQSETTICQLKNGLNPDDEHVKHEVPKCYIPLKDKYKYDITFVSNGGYVDKITYPKNVVLSFATNHEIRLIEDALLELAEARKDCVAYLDVPIDLPIHDVPNYFEHISSSYAAAYDPWAKMVLSTGSIKWMSPSFVQLYTHARSIKNGNKMYLPPAGVKRAQIPEIIETSHEISSKYLTLWQNTDSAQYINPIIWINGFDYTVYGQKTLYNMVDGSGHKESALQDLNVRLVTNQLKKLIFKTCIELTFELNNILTWNEFKSKIEPTLSTMLGEGVLTDYKILMGTETMTKADLNSGHIVGTVRISVSRAVTDWDINFELTPNNVTFTGLDYNSMY